MLRGVVQIWGREGGYGYVVSDDGRRWWCHASVIVTDAPMLQRNLLCGQFVEFEPGATRKGPIATSVRALSPDELLTAEMK